MTTKLQSLALIVLCIFNFACKSDEDGVNRKVKEIAITGDDIVEGATSVMVATVMPENALNKEVTWYVSDETIAVISEDGLLTALTNGSVTVTATAADGSGVIGTKVVSITSFVPLDQVDLMLSRSASMTGSLTIEIKDISNQTMATLVTPASTVKAGWNSFTFMPSVMLAAGLKYKIAATRSVDDETRIFWRAGLNDPYALGASSLSVNADFLFRTYSGGSMDQEQSVNDTGYIIYTTAVWQEFVPAKK